MTSPCISAVLVVEDEPLIRMMATCAIEDDGFEVKVAAHADEALAVLKQHASDVRLVVTDVNMPGTMDGLKLAHYIHEHWPWIALIVTSGKMRLGQGDLPTGTRFLPKPYDLDDMLQEIHRLATLPRPLNVSLR